MTMNVVKRSLHIFDIAKMYLFKLQSHT